jgi:hypothetical protein
MNRRQVISIPQHKENIKTKAFPIKLASNYLKIRYILIFIPKANTLQSDNAT